MKKIVLATVTALFLGTMAGVLSLRGFMQDDRPAFTLRTHHTRAGQDRALSFDRVLYVSGDGSQMEQTNYPSGKLRGLAIFQSATSTSILLAPDVMGKMTSYFPIAEKLTGKRCEEAALTQVTGRQDRTLLSSETGTFLGQRVLKIRSKGPDFRREAWFAPDCGCELLYDNYTFIDPNTQAIDGSDLTVATEVTIGEPDRSVFVEPPGYTEMTPSQMRVARYGSADKVPQCLQEQARSMEEKYARYKSRQSLDAAVAAGKICGPNNVTEKPRKAD